MDASPCLVCSYGIVPELDPTNTHHFAPEEDVVPLDLALLHCERLAARVHALIGANLGRNSFYLFDIQE